MDEQEAIRQQIILYSKQIQACAEGISFQGLKNAGADAKEPTFKLPDGTILRLEDYLIWIGKQLESIKNNTFDKSP